MEARHYTQTPPKAKGKTLSIIDAVDRRVFCYTNPVGARLAREGIDSVYLM